MGLSPRLVNGPIPLVTVQEVIPELDHDGDCEYQP